MVKQLKRWVGRLTTLTIKADKLGMGDIVYTGRVSNSTEKKDLKTINHYSFEAIVGASLPLYSKGENKVTAKEGGLVLKI